MRSEIVHELILIHSIDYHVQKERGDEYRTLSVLLVCMLFFNICLVLTVIVVPKINVQ